MTEKQMISTLKGLTFGTVVGSKGVEALEMAIQALSQEPCDDAISREELLKAIDTWDKFGVDDTNSLFRLDNLSLPHYVPYIHYDDVIKCIKGMPPVTQKSGKWIEDAKTYYEELNKRGLGVDEYTPYFTDDIACSECLAKYNTIDNETQFFKYCPNCGAKMEGSDKE